jgi:hypothetical protein
MTKRPDDGLELRLFGSPRLLRGGVVVGLEPLTLRLLAALTFRHGTPAPRPWLHERLWAGTQIPKTAGSQVRTMFVQLRRAFGPEEWRLPKGTKTLNVDGLFVDAVELRRVVSSHSHLGRARFHPNSEDAEGTENGGEMVSGVEAVGSWAYEPGGGSKAPVRTRPLGTVTADDVAVAALDLIVELSRQPFLDGWELSPAWDEHRRDIARLRSEAELQRVRAYLLTGRAPLIRSALEVLVTDDALSFEKVELLCETHVAMGVPSAALEVLRRHIEDLRARDRPVGRAARDLEHRLLRDPTVLAAISPPVVAPMNRAIRDGSPDVSRSGFLIVGREAELHQLRVVITEGGTAVIRGESGSGKSTLVAQFPQLVGNRPLFVGRCCDGDESLAAIRRTFEGLVIGGTNPSRAYEQISEFLDRSEQTVVVIEDLHWVDPASAAVLSMLFHRPPNDHVFVVTTRPTLRGRPTPLPAGGVLVNDLREVINTRTRIMDLAPLQVDAIVQLAATMNYDWSTADIERLMSLTGGLALLVREALIHVDRAGIGSLTKLSTNSAIDVMAEQMQTGFTKHEREVVAAASLLGDPIDVDVLAHVVGTDHEGLLAATDRACEARILRNELPLRFNHELIRDAIAVGLPPGRRAMFHKRAAEALVHGSPAVAAEHYLHAWGALSASESWERIERGAQFAEANQQYLLAARLNEGLLHRLVEFNIGFPDDHVRLRLRSAICHELGGRPDVGLAQRLECLGAAERHTKPQWAVDAVLSELGQGRSAVRNPERIAMLHRAELLLKAQMGPAPTEPLERYSDSEQTANNQRIAITAEWLGLESTGGGQRSNGYVDALDRMRAYVDDDQMGMTERVLAARAVSLCELGATNPIERHRLARLLAEWTHQSSDVDVRSDSYALLLRSILERGQLAEFERMRPEIEAFCNRSGRAIDVWGIESFLACWAEMSGDMTTCRDHAIRAFRIGRRHRLPDSDLGFDSQKIAWALQGLELGADELAVDVDEVLPSVILEPIGTKTVADLVVEVFLRVAFGETVAHDEIDRVTEALVRESPVLTTLPAFVLLVEVVLATKSVAAAEALVQRFQTTANFFVLVGLSAVTCLGPIQFHLGRLHCLTGNNGLGRAAYVVARDLCIEARAPNWLERCESELTQTELLLHQQRTRKPKVGSNRQETKPAEIGSLVDSDGYQRSGPVSKSESEAPNALPTKSPPSNKPRSKKKCIHDKATES